MITAIHLRNWRAYRDAKINLDYPFVFFVAPNGVGKTSLFEAARFAVLGLPAGRQVASAVRTGSQEATVSVELRMVDGADLDVTRTLRPSGRVTFTAQRDGVEIDESAYFELLRQAWGAEKGLLDRLMFGDQPASGRGGEFPVREHLAELLGVTSLLDAAQTLKERQAETKKLVASLVDEAQEVEDQARAAQDNVAAARAALEAGVANRDASAASVKEAEGLAEAARDWDRYRTEVDQYNASLKAILSELGATLEISGQEPGRRIEEARIAAETDLASIRNAVYKAELNAARSTSASDLLPANTTVCPTCLRPLTDAERARALRDHQVSASHSEEETQALRGQAEELREKLAVLDTFARRVTGLSKPTQPHADDPGSAAYQTLEEVRKADARAAEDVGQRRAELARAERHLEQINRSAAAYGKLQTASREELLLDTTRTMLELLADRYLAERVEPLVREISHRWKRLFGTEGLTLEANGELRLRRGELDLGLADLSGGERATAVIITRLLVAASTTMIPAVWFDEPLEHLDPRRRTAIAQTLVQATQTGTLDQVIVATYEEGIARRLAVASPGDVSVVYADTEPID